MSQYKIELNGIHKDSQKLSHQEMMTLLKEYQESKDEKIKERLVYDNIKLVLSLTQKYHHRSDNLEDLFQVGIIGLIKAIHNFNVDLDVRFSTYAVPLIEGEIKRYLRENNCLRVPRSLKDVSYKVLKESEKYINTFHKEASIDELSKRLNIDSSIVLEAMKSNYSVASLSQVVQTGDNDIELQDKIENKKDDFRSLQLHLDLTEAMKHLDEKESQIIHQRYYEGQTQSEIANELFISQAQVSRIEKNALHRMQKYL
jgi:RNA polymerase sporulation-specific sigma factor